MTSEERKVYKHAVDTQRECQICHISNNLVCHHIRHSGTRRTYKGNIAVLCTRCHALVHTNTKHWTPVLVEKINKLYGMDLGEYIKPDKCVYANLEEEE